jgi:hypothetical protein
MSSQICNSSRPVCSDERRSSLSIGPLACALRGMRPLVAHCHLGLGRLCRRTGKRQEAKEHLTTAMTLYREMDMTYWLEQAEAEIGLLG